MARRISGVGRVMVSDRRSTRTGPAYGQDSCTCEWCCTVGASSGAAALDWRWPRCRLTRSATGAAPTTGPLRCTAPEPTLPAPRGWPGPDELPPHLGHRPPRRWRLLLDRLPLRRPRLHSALRPAATWPRWARRRSAVPLSSRARARQRRRHLPRRRGLSSRRATYWRVDWNTLADPGRPDRGVDVRHRGLRLAPARVWPAGAGVHSPGIDTRPGRLRAAAPALHRPSRDGRRLRHPAGDRRPRRRSFVVRVPRAVLAAVRRVAHPTGRRTGRRARDGLRPRGRGAARPARRLQRHVPDAAAGGAGRQLLERQHPGRSASSPATSARSRSTCVGPTSPPGGRPPRAGADRVERPVVRLVGRPRPGQRHRLRRGGQRPARLPRPGPAVRGVRARRTTIAPPRR